MTLVEVLYIKMFSKVGKTTKMTLNTDDKQNIYRQLVFNDTTYLHSK